MTCPDCEGDGYQERFNDDQSDVIITICSTCEGTGQAEIEAEYLCEPKN